MKTLLILASIAFSATTFIGATTTPRVSIRTNPVIVFAGGSMWVTCKVPRDPANRRVEIAVVPYRSSDVQLNGDDAAITNRILFERIPCFATEAACVLHSQAQPDAIAIQTIQVAGCDQW